MQTQILKTITINAPTEIVWQNLTLPALMKKWIGEPEMQIEISTNWQIGSLINITGFHHVHFQNTGTVLQFKPHQTIQYSHLSSVSKLPNTPESYTIITFQLKPKGQLTQLTVQINNFPTESIFKHLNFYWETTIHIIKN